jgi:hypothetical protein
MSAQPLEQLNSPLNAPENSDCAAVVFDALQTYFGDRRLRNYTRYERRDYTGDASNKVRVGGALVVECVVYGDEGFVKNTIEIDDDHRPFDEDVITALAEDAPIWVRDIIAR